MITILRSTTVGSENKISKVQFTFLFDIKSELPKDIYQVNGKIYIITEDSIAIDNNTKTVYKYTNNSWIKTANKYLGNPASISSITISNINDSGTYSFGDNYSEGMNSIKVVVDENINKPYFIKVRFSDGSVEYYTDSTDAKTAIKADDTPKTLYIGDISLGTMEGASTFNGCDALIEVNLGKYLDHLAIGCFAGCDNLTTINIPNQMNFISYNAFNACPNLTKIIVDRPEGSISNAPWGATNATITWTGKPAPDDGGGDNPK